MPAPIEQVAIGLGRVPALYVRPQASEPCPAVLLQHGYGAQKSDFVPLATILAACGFATLLPDAWGHGDRPRDAGLEWWSRMPADYLVEMVRHTADDLRAALTWLEERPEVRTDAIALGGFSMGAMAALIVGTEDPRPAAVISVSGSPLPDLADAMRPGAAGPSESTRRWVLEHDAAAHIGRLAPRPLLLQHGRRDDVVPVAGTLRLHEAARPHYAAHPDRLSLMLYDHAHTGTERQLQDAMLWMAPFFMGDEAAA
jgi:fermentation-respiration switch protein FrsA (DUF1100 family)